MNIFAYKQSALNYVPSRTQRRCDDGPEVDAMKPSVEAGQKANSKLACATNFPVDANETRVSVKADALPKRKTSALT